MTRQDIDTHRNNCPGIPQTIHFNNAGSSLPPRSVLQASIDYLEEEARVGGYELMVDRAADLQQVYASVATMIGAKPSEIALCESATDGWYRALHSIDWELGDEILISRAEYGPNVLAYLALKEQRGVTFRLIPDDATGAIDLEALESAIGPQTKLIALSHMPTHGGLVNPAAAVGTIAQRHGVLYLLDACQAVGQIPLSVEELSCDFLAATGRKFLRGPRGTGFLYVRTKALPLLRPPRPDLWSAHWTGPESYEWEVGARRFENFEFSRALRLGLGAAAQYYLDAGPEAIWLRIQSLAERLRRGLAAIPQVTLEDKGHVLSGIVTFTVAGQDPDDLHRQLLHRKLQLSVSRAQGAWLDMPSRGLDKLLRASVHYFLLEEEVDFLIESIGELAKEK